MTIYPVPWGVATGHTPDGDLLVLQDWSLQDWSCKIGPASDLYAIDFDLHDGAKTAEALNSAAPFLAFFARSGDFPRT
jgi:hypothetical protein